MKKRVKILQSIAGTGDPSKEDLERKYTRIRSEAIVRSNAAKQIGKPGKTEAEIDSLVNEEKKRDAAIPRLSGHIGQFAYKPGDEVALDAELAEKWEACGVCTLLPNQKAA